MDSEPLAAVWYAIPSARADGGTLNLWKAKGYKIAVQRDFGAELLEDIADIAYQTEYAGYADAVNGLCVQILRAHPETQIIVTGGDDIEPPEQSPHELASEFAEHYQDLYGIMQPTGDTWSDSQGRLAARVAGSPWMGRAWCLEANGGGGPLWNQYKHFFVDEELQLVALAQGVLWQRADVCQYHRHWSREKSTRRHRPEHVLRLDTTANWREAKALFDKRKAASFPGSERKRMAKINDKR